MGTTRADFHKLGNLPDKSDRLKTFAKGGAILSEVAYICRAVATGGNGGH